ncbi:MAG: SpoIIE family protein phosphatase [bacterium]
MSIDQSVDTAQESEPGRKKILAVDDSKLNVFLLQKTLGAENYEVIAAYSGEEALRRIREDNPDLVLLDVMMPGMDGYEVCREIKRYCESETRFIPVVLLTALDNVESKITGLESGADEYLVKPLDRDELLARVRSMLRIKDLQERLLQMNSQLNQAQKIIEEELKIVGQIQRSFLPSTFPKHEKIDIASSYLPSSQAGGDYFDIIEVDEHNLGIVMADVTGHGASAAVVMAVTHLLMRSFVNTFKFPSTALKVVNEKLNSHLSSDHYVTMFYGILNTETMRFVYSSAGHIPMYHHCASDGSVHEMRTEFGFPLRAFQSDNYDEVEIQLKPGDKMVLFTDGIVESLSEAHQVYGEERMIQVIRKEGCHSAQNTIDALIWDWTQFRGRSPMRDDMTLLALRYIPE